MRADPSQKARAATAVARLAHRALALGTQPDALFGEVVGVLREVLGADSATVMELVPAERRLVVRAASGWNPEPAETDATTPDASLAAFALAEGVPVKVDDLTMEHRCGHEILDQAGFKSAIGAPIEGVNGPYGIVGVHSRTPMCFDDEAVRFVASVTGVLAQAIDRVRAEEQLRTRAQLLDAVGEAVIVTDLGGIVRYWNRAAEQLYGWTSEEMLGTPAETLATTEEIRAAQGAIRAHLAAGHPWTGEMEVLRKDGTKVPVQVTSTPLVDEQGHVTGVVAAVADQTQRRALESKMRHAVKMEAVGRLAGGVAHDFNNILGAILGHAELLLRRRDLPGDSRADVDAIRRGVERAAVLTRQLLAFGRQQLLSPTQVDPAVELRRLEPMIRRLVGESVEVKVKVSPGCGRIRVDRSQLEQVVLSLVTNAAEAMGSRGGLSVSLAPVVPDDDLRARVDHLPEGPCVALSVTDTGPGIPDADLHRIFDPFFSTKGLGHGLGLAAVHGTVRQSGGAVEVEALPAGGTRFTVYLPQEPAIAQAAPPPAPRVAPRRGRLLLVEDDPLVRRVVVRILETEGFEVEAAGSATEALTRVQDAGRLPDLLITDVAMPGVGGPALAAHLRGDGDLPVLFISGYAGRPEVHDALHLPHSELVAKPFTPEVLLDAVARLLAG